MIVTVALLALYEFQSTRPLRGATRSPSIISKVRILFQSTHPLRGATTAMFWGRGSATFQSTHPLRGATKADQLRQERINISIHAPLAGCDRRKPNSSFPSLGFQSTHPLRGATLRLCDMPTANHISIHAPLAGCDGLTMFQSCLIWHFNPRTPCGVRLHRYDRYDRYDIFQSTHPLRGATAQEAAELARHIISIHAPLAGCDAAVAKLYRAAVWISIHAPLAGCDENSDVVPRPNEISIHAPLAGCDRRRDFLLSQAGAFQSTHPLRGATGRKRYVPSAVSVFQSTHPLRGATNGCGHGLSCPAGFQSTHPLRGATDPAHAADCNKKISIHAPLAGCDRSARSTETRMDDFNPRTPCGVRPIQTGIRDVIENQFQSTHPLRGATQCLPICRCSSIDFNPRTPCGVRPLNSWNFRTIC